MARNVIISIFTSTLIGLTAPAMAQTGGAQTQGSHTMPGMDMQAMMGQCTQMRQQMKPGMVMSFEMQTMMKNCNAMDAQMRGGSGSAAQEAPRTR